MGPYLDVHLFFVPCEVTVSAILDDLRLGARTVRQHPGFTLGVSLTLASGIAATAARAT